VKAPQTQSPEDQLLVQFQGMIAEYERAQILERSRRGKRHRAKQGEVSDLSGAPYGYRYVRKTEGCAAFYEVDETQAQVVRQVFDLYTAQALSIGAITRRLNELAVPTRKEHACWERSTIWAMLRNPAYRGMACFGKTGVRATRQEPCHACGPSTSARCAHHTKRRGASGSRSCAAWWLSVRSIWRRNACKTTRSSHPQYGGAQHLHGWCIAPIAATRCIDSTRSSAPRSTTDACPDAWRYQGGHAAQSRSELICWRTLSGARSRDCSKTALIQAELTRRVEASVHLIRQSTTDRIERELFPE
jgi:hypothetical protein